MKKAILVIFSLLMIFSLFEIAFAENIPPAPMPPADSGLAGVGTGVGPSFPWDTLLGVILGLTLLILSIMIKESRSWIKIVGTTILVIWILPILYLLGCLGYSTMVKFNIFEYCYGEGFFILWIVGITIVLLIGGAILYGINRLSNLIRKKF